MLKREYSKLIALAMIFLASGCDWFTKKSDEQKEVVIGQPVNLKVINVLAKELYDDAHIAGSINIPFGEVDKVAQSENWPKDIHVILYCSNFECAASLSEARKLKNLGFVNAAAFEGGMAEWYQLAQKDPSYKFAGPAKEEYLKEVVGKPEEKVEDIKIITAQELKEHLEKAGVLK